MRYIISLFTLFFCLSSFSQSKEYQSKPKLVVGIVVDQMRYDYIPRFYTKYGNGGFKRLINEGFEFRNHHFNYIPTYTGPGHASIFTGTTPENHGIIANNWYDKFKDKRVYCVSDNSVKPLGTKSDEEQMSPKNMQTTTLGDANRIDTQFRGKTIGISMKDRGAILSAGHTANRAYWFRGKNEGQWVSSDYYGTELPKWVIDFNKKKSVDNYFKTWETLQPIGTYIESGADLNKYEIGFKGKEVATFPYDLKKLRIENSEYDILKSSPFGNSILTDFAIEALKQEQLGKDDDTDVLTISFSSTDYIGHNFGVNSKEIQDTYMRLDLEIEKLLEALDTKVGKGQYTVFLTADHGAVHVPQFLKDNKMPGGYFNFNLFNTGITKFLEQEFGVKGLIKNHSNKQLFFNYSKIKETKISITDLSNKLQLYISKQQYVQYVFTREQLVSRSINNEIGKLVQNGFHQRRSGDIAYVLKPATIIYGKKGTTHGSPQVYDTHVPLLFFGKGIKKGRSFKKTRVMDIAPTVCAVLAISKPNGCTGDVLYQALKQ